MKFDNILYRIDWYTMLLLYIQAVLDIIPFSLSSLI